MATCTLGIGAAPWKTEQANEKSLQTESLGYSIARSTLQVPFLQVEKPNVKFSILLAKKWATTKSILTETEKIYSAKISRYIV